MLKAAYDKEKNLVTVKFEGKIDFAQAEPFYEEVQKILPTCGKGFKLLTDFTLLDQMDIEVQPLIKKTMDLFNEKGVTEIIRIIPTPEQDFGFSIMSLFHYSREVKSMTVQSREEALARLEPAKK